MRNIPNISKLSHSYLINFLKNSLEKLFFLLNYKFQSFNFVEVFIFLVVICSLHWDLSVLYFYLDGFEICSTFCLSIEAILAAIIFSCCVISQRPYYHNLSWDEPNPFPKLVIFVVSLYLNSIKIMQLDVHNYQFLLNIYYRSMIINIIIDISFFFFTSNFISYN